MRFHAPVMLSTVWGFIRLIDGTVKIEVIHKISELCSCANLNTTSLHEYHIANL